MKQIVKDIYLIYDFMDDSHEIVEKIRNQCKFLNFTINNKILSRKGSFEGILYEDGSYPWLRCPSIEHQQIYPISPIIQQIKNKISSNLGCETNIFKIQEYNDGKIIINSHSDKILDLEEKTPIFILRFGETRTCTLTHKENNEKINFLMPHNTILIINYDGNIIWKHGISIDETISEKSYSIVCRKSITFKHPSFPYVYGKHTPFKTMRYMIDWMLLPSNKYYWSESEQSKKIIECYKIENKQECDITLYSDIIENAIYPF
jgi:hypothetical protein